MSKKSHPKGRSKKNKKSLPNHSLVDPQHLHKLRKKNNELLNGMAVLLIKKVCAEGSVLRPGEVINDAFSLALKLDTEKGNCFTDEKYFLKWMVETIAAIVIATHEFNQMYKKNVENFTKRERKHR